VFHVEPTQSLSKSSYTAVFLCLCSQMLVSTSTSFWCNRDKYAKKLKGVCLYVLKNDLEVGFSTCVPRGTYVPPTWFEGPRTFS
jgi:hypothetical protein